MGILNVYRSNVQNGTYTKIGQYLDNSPVTLTNEPAGTNYYKLSLQNAAGEGEVSSAAGQIVLAKPSTPTATNTAGKVTINTPLPSGATGIVVEQSNGSTWKQIYSGANASVALTSLADGVYFRSKGTATNAESALSEVFTYSAPTIGAFTLTATQNGTTANLSWTAATNAQRYDVYKNGAKITETTATSYAATNTTANATFFVKAIAGLTTKESNAMNYVYQTPESGWINVLAEEYVVPLGSTYNRCEWEARIELMESAFSIFLNSNQIQNGEFEGSGDFTVKPGDRIEGYANYSYDPGHVYINIRLSTIAVVIGAFTLTATQNDTTANLSWTAAANAQRYEVYRNGVKIGDTTARTYAVANVTVNATFVVKAIAGSATKDSNTVNYEYQIAPHLTFDTGSTNNYEFAVPAGYTKCAWNRYESDHATIYISQNGSEIDRISVMSGADGEFTVKDGDYIYFGTEDMHSSLGIMITLT